MSDLVIHGYVDIEVRPNAAPGSAIKAMFSPVTDISARGATKREAQLALAAEVRRIADSIEKLAGG